MATSTFLPDFPKFSLDESEMHSVGIRWKKYVSRFNNFITAMNIEDQTRKRALLLHYGGFELQDIFEVLDNTGTTIEDLTNAFSRYFEPKTNECFEVWNFQKTIQNDGETLQSYYVRLKTIASRCNFDSINQQIKTQLILGTTSNKLRKYCFSNKEASLQDILTRGKLYEDVEHQSQEIEAGATNNIGEASPAEEVQVLRKQIADLQMQVHKKEIPSKSCFNCGNAWPHAKQCPAKNQVCRSCGKLNHFARVCRSSRKHSMNPPPSRYPVRFVQPGTEQSVDPLAENCFSVNRVNSLHPKDKLRTFKTSIKVSGHSIPVLIDTGCSTNILNIETFQRLQKTKQHKLRKSQVCLVPYGSSTETSQLKVLGVLQCLAESKRKLILDEFFVLNTKAPNLIGGNLAIELGLLSTTFQEIEINNITPTPMLHSDVKANSSDRTTHIPERLHSLLTEYKAVFNGTGKLKDQPVKLHIDESVKPVAQKPRRIPFHLRQKVDKELDKLRKADIIEDVTDQPTPWVSPIVVVPKKNNPDEIRMCIDMRQANKAIKRTRHPAPSIDDLIHDLNGAKYFCKLDMTSAFLQLELEPGSRSITTFSTHQGLHRYKRLNFGTSSASEELQIKLENILRDIPGCKNIADDIILFAQSLKELDTILEKVLQRFGTYGLTLNLEKCEFDKSSVEFFGFIFSAAGISPSPEKVRAIQLLAPPTNPTEMRSFLGMTNFLGRFIPHYADIATPLRNLTKQDTTWSWGPVEQSAFNQLKQSLSSNTVMSYFSPQKSTTIVTDAGPHGISAILLQHTPQTEDYRVIAYSSRALSDTESRYSQLEKECLAIVHGCEKFSIYILGSDFEILTDHKPLVSLLSNPKSTLPLRIERWCLRLQGFSFNIRHINGSFNPADYCSRHTVPDSNTNSTRIIEEYVNFTTKHAEPIAITLDEIKVHTKNDPTLQCLKELIRSTKWYSIDTISTKYPNCNVKELHLYNKIRNEFTCNNDESLILRGNRIVAPTSLRHRMLKLAHETHLGMTKTKSILRDKIYFPDINQQVETLCKNCSLCIANSRMNPPPPLKPSPLPPSPWHTLNIDFLGPLPNRSHLLVVIDQRTRFPEVEIVGSTAALPTLGALSKIFATHGLPHKIISDNGSPFHSNEFKRYMHAKGIDHHRITPLHPKANSTAENFMRNLNKTLRIATIEGKPWKIALYNFLLNYRISTHSTTGVSPAEALFQRQVRGKLPSLNNQPNRDAIKEAPHRDAQQKLKMKKYVDARFHARQPAINKGDYVLVKQPKRNKLSSPFDPKPYCVTRVQGTKLTASRPGHTITRNVQHFKFLSKLKPTNFDQEGEEEDDIDTPGEYETTTRPTELYVRKYPQRIRRRPDYFHENVPT